MKIIEILSENHVETIGEDCLLDYINTHITEKAYVYAVLDYAVVLGELKDGNIKVGFGLTNKIEDLQLAYVQELRVFNDKSELRAIRSEDIFNCRIRVDEKQETFGAGNKCYVMDENHKLWGSVKKNNSNGWSLLRSKRGSAILYPEILKEHDKIAIQVRNYIEYKEAQEECGLIHYVDERFCGFTLWAASSKGESNE